MIFTKPTAIITCVHIWIFGVVMVLSTLFATARCTGSPNCNTEKPVSNPETSSGLSCGNQIAQTEDMKNPNDSFFYDKDTFERLLKEIIDNDKESAIFSIHMTKRLKVPYGFVVKKDGGIEIEVRCFTQSDSADTKTNPAEKTGCDSIEEIQSKLAEERQIVRYGKILFTRQEDIDKKIKKFIDETEEEEEKFASPRERKKDEVVEEEEIFASPKKKFDCSTDGNGLCKKCGSRPHTYYNISHLYNHLFCGGNYDNPPSFNTWDPGFLRYELVREWKRLKKPGMPSCGSINEVLKVEKPDFFRSDVDGLSYTWLGHATVLVRLHGVNIITDPVFDKRLSFSRFVGPWRVTDSPCERDGLPKIDIVAISHCHYDHLEMDTVRKISEHNPDAVWCVPLGVDKLLEEAGVDSKNIRAMTWGQKSDEKILVDTDAEKKVERDVTVTCTPAQHWGMRWLKYSLLYSIALWVQGKSVQSDAFERLWSSWAVTIKGETFFFSGDSGICKKEFIKIGQEFENIRLAAISIGCYKPKWFMRSQHMGPVDAVKAFLYLKAKSAFPIHWGTYDTDATEGFLDPAKEFGEGLKKEGLDEGKFQIVPIGRTVSAS